MVHERELDCAPAGEPVCELLTVRRSAGTLAVKCIGSFDCTATARFTGVRVVRFVGLTQVSAVYEVGLDSPMLQSLVRCISSDCQFEHGEPLFLYRFGDCGDPPCLEVVATGCTVTKAGPSKWPY
jgi:hypothetical protein